MNVRNFKATISDDVIRKLNGRLANTYASVHISFKRFFMWASRAPKISTESHQKLRLLLRWSKQQTGNCEEHLRKINIHWTSFSAYSGLFVHLFWSTSLCRSFHKNTSSPPAQHTQQHKFMIRSGKQRSFKPCHGLPKVKIQQPFQTVDNPKREREHRVSNLVTFLFLPVNKMNLSFAQ